MITIKHFLSIYLFSILFSQNCNCESDFQWLKQTFEENDAGFQYAIDKKGRANYQTYTEKLIERLKTISKQEDCLKVMNEWLSFFRPDHISISLNSQRTSNTNQEYLQSKSIPVNLTEFESYLSKKEAIDLEGVWQGGGYKFAIRKIDNVYTGIIIEANNQNWKRNEVKLLIENDKAIYYMGNKSKMDYDIVELYDKNALRIGPFQFWRIFPEYPVSQSIKNYKKSAETNSAYIEELNENTLYLRIPSFASQEKQLIDSLLHSNFNKLIETDNLIIDLRNNGGGSDYSYLSILPFLYTNPIRTIGTEFLSTKLNNQRMLDLMKDPNFNSKEWAKKSYEKLEKNRGKFVLLDDTIISTYKLSKAYLKPISVGIIINEQN
ncbi:MAG: peptidase S41, partial [Calditrichaeota bacterium]|nr:peptidase S41 [Calditrichota bacterium]